jgi:hypothetical protein
MRVTGVIQQYALFGAVAQMRYSEAVATFDADVLVAVPAPERLDVLSGIYEFCASRGLLSPMAKQSLRMGGQRSSCPCSVHSRKKL